MDLFFMEFSTELLACELDVSYFFSEHASEMLEEMKAILSTSWYCSLAIAYLPLNFDPNNLIMLKEFKYGS